MCVCVCVRAASCVCLWRSSWLSCAFSVKPIPTLILREERLQTQNPNLLNHWDRLLCFQALSKINDAKPDPWKLNSGFCISITCKYNLTSVCTFFVSPSSTYSLSILHVNQTCMSCCDSLISKQAVARLLLSLSVGFVSVCDLVPEPRRFGSMIWADGSSLAAQPLKSSTLNGPNGRLAESRGDLHLTGELFDCWIWTWW